MLCKRIIPCLDVSDGRVVKGTNFNCLRDAGDPVALASEYYRQGADELIFLDISATINGKKTMVDVAREVAKEIFIPFTLGGGIRTMSDIRALLGSGADRVSLNTSAIENPGLIRSAAEEFGSQAVVVAIDAKKVNGKWIVFSRCGTKSTGLDVVEWAKDVVSLGAGELLITSIDRDGTNNGFDIALYKSISKALNISVIASGGAGSEKDFLDIFEKTDVSAALGASTFHYQKIRIPSLKNFLKKNGVGMREIDF
jgi:cyclase